MWVFFLPNSKMGTAGGEIFGLNTLGIDPNHLREFSGSKFSFQKGLTDKKEKRTRVKTKHIFRVQGYNWALIISIFIFVHTLMVSYVSMITAINKLSTMYMNNDMKVYKYICLKKWSGYHPWIFLLTYLWKHPWCKTFMKHFFECHIHVISINKWK